MKQLFVRRWGLFTVAAAAILTGCAPSVQKLENETLLPEIDIVQLKENSDQALKIAQETRLTVQTLNSRMTEIDNRLTALSDEVSSVSLAKIEELENRLSLLIEAYKDLQEQIAALEVMPRVKVKKGNEATATFSPNSALPVTQEYTLYETGLKAFDKRVWDEAEKIFTEVIAKYPKSAYAPQAQYWIGEGYFTQGELAKAIAAFQKVQTYDKNSKNDDAQFKIGQSYFNMGKYDHAREALSYLVDRYPGSDFVPRAQKLLEEIKATASKAK
jgi:tol-pal system protein YbgF